ncbi:hypothetical protein WA026_023515 [Henosepilachna vigintioctopunctata]|uniref:Uncharacterized protein n=1 Tax=Henosepilachna vigintioctopunctata TaxID=420089 RepID=A0AAW1TZK4_9CUCU
MVSLKSVIFAWLQNLGQRKKSNLIHQWSSPLVQGTRSTALVMRTLADSVLRSYDNSSMIGKHEVPSIHASRRDEIKTPREKRKLESTQSQSDDQLILKNAGKRKKRSTGEQITSE